jgi:hypothetical protein
MFRFVIHDVRIIETSPAEIPVTIKFPYNLYSTPAVSLAEIIIKVRTKNVVQYFKLKLEKVLLFFGNFNTAYMIMSPPIIVLACCNILKMGSWIPNKPTVYFSEGIV